MKTIAVLGAGGFLGRSLCERLSTTKNTLIFASFRKSSCCNIPIEHVDLTQENALSRWLGNRKIDALFYLSSLMPYQYPGRDWDLLRGNLAMHQNVFDCWAKHKFHLIYASGTTVYAPSAKPLNESSMAMPQSFYTVSKLWGENLFWLGSQSQKLPLSIMRISAPYGHKERNLTVVNTFFNKAIHNLDLELLGSGRRQQDFIYVKDAVEGMFSAFRKRKYGIFNVAGGKTITMKQLAREVIRATNSTSKIVFNGKPDPQEMNKIKIDIQKSSRELGFKPKFSLAEGLKDMVRVYQRGA